MSLLGRFTDWRNAQKAVKAVVAILNNLPRGQAVEVDRLVPNGEVGVRVLSIINRDYPQFVVVKTHNKFSLMHREVVDSLSEHTSKQVATSGCLSTRGEDLNATPLKGG